MLLLWVYAFVTGLSPSVMRSALMLCFWELTYLMGRHTSRWNPYPSRSGNHIDDQSVGIMEREFSIEFCCCLGNYVDSLLDAATYEIKEYME